MIKVRAKDNEPAETMIRRFKRLCEKEGIAREIKRTTFYEKPSEKRRRKAKKTFKRYAGI